MNRYDVIVIGAGPAGLAAAIAASEKRVLLLDSAPRPGGQYWRHRAGHEPRDRAFRTLTGQLHRVDYRPNTSVWYVEPSFAVHTNNEVYGADRLVIATGAHDRCLPFPGWLLPGVVTAGGAQALLKGQGVAIGRMVVVSGAGPFLLPVAAGLARAGVRVAGVFEAGRPQSYVRHPIAVTKAFETLGYGLSFARHRIPYFTGHRVVAAHGDGRLEAVTIGTRIVECDALAVGYGFTPQVELAVALGCETTVDGDGSLVVYEAHQSASTPGVYVAGEVTGVGGAALALVEGRLAGLAAADRELPPRLLRRRESLRRFASLMSQIHRVSPDINPDINGEEAASTPSTHRRLPVGGRAVPDAGGDDAVGRRAGPDGGDGGGDGRGGGYGGGGDGRGGGYGGGGDGRGGGGDARGGGHGGGGDGDGRGGGGDVVVCRCESVTAGAIRRACVELGVVDARGAKLMTRAGMGWCQGRVCGHAVAHLVASACGREVTAADLRAFANRPIAQPVTLGDLAASGPAADSFR